MNNSIHALLVFIMLANSFLFGKTNKTEPPKPQEIPQTSVMYGTVGSEPTRSDLHAPLLSEQVKALESKKVEDLTLKMDADPAIYIPGKPITISWKITGSKNLISGSDTKVQLRLPEGATIVDKTLAASLTPELTLPLGNLLDNSQGIEIDVQKAVPPFYFSIEIYQGDKFVSGNSILIDAEKYPVTKGVKNNINGMNDKVKIEVPAAAAEQNLAFDIRNPSPNKLPAVSLTGNPIEIIAVDKSTGKNLKTFKEPLAIQIAYQEEDITIGAEADLMVYYYDEVIADWFPMETIVDTEKNTLSIKSDHLTVFDYKAASWQTNSVPTLDDFKVSGFTGAATYDMGFWLPPAQGGFQPNLTLSYNSQTIDDSTAYTQAGWVGAGWSLDTGAILRNMHETSSITNDDTFSMTINGVSSQLLPISVVGSVITYTTSNQTFMRITRDTTADTWKVWDQKGNIYIFDKQAKTNTTNGCVAAASLNLTWRWSLGSVTDINGNAITYTYYNEVKSASCYNVVAVYPEFIVYPNDQYRVKFVRAARTDYQTAWTATTARVLYGKYSLAEVDIEKKLTANWETSEVLRRYKFTYAISDGTSNQQIYPRFQWSAAGYTLTLLGVQEFSGDNTANLPATQFSYNLNTTGGYEDNLHLRKVDNGQGATVQFNYERWAYFDDVNDRPRALFILYGTDECRGSVSTDHTWVGILNPVRVRCEMGGVNRLQIGQDPNMSIAHHSVPENVAKPGGRILMNIKVQAIQGSTDANWGIADTSTGNSNMLYSDTWMPNIGSTWVTLEDAVEFPISYKPSTTFFRMECNDCRVWKVEFSLFPNEYRVTSQVVSDQVTGLTNTTTYTYDNASPNTSLTSEAVAAVGTTYGPTCTPTPTGNSAGIP